MRGRSTSCSSFIVRTNGHKRDKGENEEAKRRREREREMKDFQGQRTRRRESHETKGDEKEIVSPPVGEIRKAGFQ